MRRTRSALALLVVGCLLMLSAPASAHVTLDATTASPGTYAMLTFRVQSERTLPTMRLEISLPRNRPLASVSVQPHLGWAYRATKTKAPNGLRDEHGPVKQFVSKVMWVAVARGIKPGEFDEFQLLVGPLPDVSALVFPAVQTYKDGTVVRWVETGDAVRRNPAPVLRIVSAASSKPSASPSAAPAASPAPVVTATAPDEDRRRKTELLAAAGAGAGGIALLVALIALVSSRRRY
ncbi:MAG TPA: YcnI family protein [Mycobacteriales bacterium]|nr:YcnI family protein [Mycobacteriales bacterium]